MRYTLLPILGFTLAALASTAAAAADLPSRRAPPVFAPPPIPVFTWTGFYAGVNAGSAFDQKRTNSYYFPNGSVQDINTGLNDGPGGEDGVLSLFDRNGSGFTGGGQIGYNYQLGSGPSPFGAFGGLGGVVVGVEADAQHVGFRRIEGATGNYAFAPTNGNIANDGLAFVPVPGLAAPTVITSQRRLSYYGTVRGRLGYAINRFLLFGTGGYAYSNNGSGYTYGGGLEFALTNNITIRGEFFHVNLDRGSGANTAVFDLAANTFTFSRVGGQESFNVARAALNYKIDFGFPMAPVVARY